ncbi:hypothetical protein KKG41_02060 [Patescibacteria group bacterium]|nr:hypothetical protein [Patescibacteria group bacterium]MBU1890510.1 hypothetical protein [Patescibacteria group bacterium]
MVHKLNAIVLMLCLAMALVSSAQGRGVGVFMDVVQNSDSLMCDVRLNVRNFPIISYITPSDREMMEASGPGDLQLFLPYMIGKYGNQVFSEIRNHQGNMTWYGGELIPWGPIDTQFTWTETLKLGIVLEDGSIVLSEAILASFGGVSPSYGVPVYLSDGLTATFEDIQIALGSNDKCLFWVGFPQGHRLEYLDESGVVEIRLVIDGENGDLASKTEVTR